MPANIVLEEKAEDLRTLIYERKVATTAHTHIHAHTHTHMHTNIHTLKQTHLRHYVATQFREAVTKMEEAWEMIKDM